MKNWIIVGALIVALAALPAFALARQDSIGLDIRVWRAADDHERIFVSARAEGGSWADLGTLPVDFDQTTANGRFDYRDFALEAPGYRTDTGFTLATPCEVWLEYIDDARYRVGVVDTLAANDSQCRQINDFTRAAREADTVSRDDYDRAIAERNSARANAASLRARLARLDSIRCVFFDGATVHTRTQDECDYLKLKVNPPGNSRGSTHEPPAATCDIRESARTVAAATVRVHGHVAGGYRNGTAFHVGRGYFITAHHAVEGAHSVTLYGDGWSQTASVVHYWPRTERPSLYGVPVGTLDVAVLQAYGWPSRAFAYDWASAPTLTPDDAFDVGDAVGLFGFPNGAARSAFGSVTGYWPDFNSLLQHSAIGAPGSSGSPVFDECGGVIGVQISGDDNLSLATAIHDWVACVWSVGQLRLDGTPLCEAR